MKKELIKGNEAVVKAAILAGCTHYFGYPITPASDIDEAAAHYFPLLGLTFIQAESEIAAINMHYGASAAGVRALSASSGPGMSLKMEGFSYLAGAELPAVVVDVMRAGPGLGNVWPEQSDYNQVVKGGGHGNYKNIVLAPNSAQEMCDLTLLAFDLADKYRMTSIVLADGSIGQVMEPVEFPEKLHHTPHREWAVRGDAASRKNLITSIYMSTELEYALNERLQKKYAEIEEKEVLFENYKTEDAEMIVVAYGITSRVARSAIDELRDMGLKIGLHRPKTLFPFPKKELKSLAAHTKSFLVAEMSNGQMIDDVKLAIECSRPVDFWGTFGGILPTVEHMKASIQKQYKQRNG
jgi:pyruvate/2-oxoacid:ferredoxin oxidoreductase alpha subunit